MTTGNYSLHIYNDIFFKTNININSKIKDIKITQEVKKKKGKVKNKNNFIYKKMRTPAT